MKEYISYSQLQMFLRCGVSYYYRYCENLIIAPELSLVKGKSVHRGIEHNGFQKITSKTDLKKKEIVEAAVNEYETEVWAVEATPEEKGECKDGVVSLSGLYADDIAPKIQPLFVEKEINVSLEGVIPVKAIIDCIDDKKVIRDFKTTGKKKAQKDIDSSLQFTLYYLAYQQEFKEDPAGLAMDVLIDKKVPEYQPLTSARSMEQTVLAIRKIHAVVDAIQKGVFLPPAEGSWACSPDWCGYYKVCKYMNSGVF